MTDNTYDYWFEIGEVVESVNGIIGVVTDRDTTGPPDWPETHKNYRVKSNDGITRGFVEDCLESITTTWHVEERAVKSAKNREVRWKREVEKELAKERQNPRLRFVCAPGLDLPVLVIDRCEYDPAELFGGNKPDWTSGVLAFSEEVDIEEIL